MIYTCDYVDELCDLMKLREAIQEIFSWIPDGCLDITPYTFGEDEEFKEMRTIAPEYYNGVNDFFNILDGCVSQRIAKILSESSKLDECEICCDCAVDPEDRKCNRKDN